MPFTQVGTQTISYDEYGQGQPLLLIPGLSAWRLYWWKQITPFSQKYHLITMDNRDVGDSTSAKGPYTIADMADDAAGLISNLHLGPTQVIGWSMGSFISLEMTLRHPTLVDKLILVSTSAGGLNHIPPSPEIIALLLGTEYENIETRVRSIYSVISGPGYMQTHPEDLDQIVRHAQAKPMTLEAYMRQLNAIMTWSGVGERLDQITLPTMVIHGETDPLVTYPNGRYLAEHIKGAKLMSYAGVGHLPHIEATERFNNDVLEFLAS